METRFIISYLKRRLPTYLFTLANSWSKWGSSTIDSRSLPTSPFIISNSTSDNIPATEEKALTADGKAGLAVSLPSLLVGVAGVGIAFVTLIVAWKRRAGQDVVINVQVNVLVGVV